MIAAMAEPAIGDQAKRNGSSGRADGNGAGPDAILGPLGAAARAAPARRPRDRRRRRRRHPVRRQARGRRGATGAGGADRRPRRPRPRLHPREPAPGVALATLWYRAEVRNMGNVPEEGPVLLVGNHTGGNMAPEVVVLPLAFSTYFGVERPFYQLAHNLVLASPFGRTLRRYGTMAASHEHAREGARRPAPRCSSSRAATGRSTARAGRATGSTSPAARASSAWRSNADVPIVPVVTIGGQETALFLSRGGLAGEAHRRRQAAAAQGPADLARAAVGPERRRPARPHPAAGEDHDRGRCRRSTCARSSAPSPTSTRSTTTSPA